MTDLASLARAAAAMGLPFAACRLDLDPRDRSASPGTERATCRDLLAEIAGTLTGPSGWLWGDTGLVRVAGLGDLRDYDGILFSAEIGSGPESIHVRALAAATWRITGYRESADGEPTHLVEAVTLLGASLRDMPDLARARVSYRRYWQAAPGDRSRPVAVRLLELR